MKCVIVLRKDLPIGLAANAAAVLALSLGRETDVPIGPAAADGDGAVHPGITAVPLPVLGAEEEGIRAIASLCRTEEFAACRWVAFTETARRERDYGAYTASLAERRDGELGYLGIGLYGPRRSVERLTGSLALLR